MDFGFKVLVSGFFFSGTWIADFKRGEIALWYCLGESIALFTLLLLLTFSTLRAGASLGQHLSHRQCRRAVH